MSVQRTVLVAAMVAVCLGFAGEAMAKRSAPKPVKPVEIDGVIYRAMHEKIYEGDKLVAFAASIHARPAGEQHIKPWKAEVFRVVYRQDLESDVQDIWITTIAKGNGGKIIVTDERERRFSIDPKTHEVTRLEDQIEG